METQGWEKRTLLQSMRINLERLPRNVRETAARSMASAYTDAQARAAYDELAGDAPINPAGLWVLAGLDSPIHAALAQRLGLNVTYRHMILDIPIRHGAGRFADAEGGE